MTTLLQLLHRSSLSVLAYCRSLTRSASLVLQQAIFGDLQFENPAALYIDQPSSGCITFVPDNWKVYLQASPFSTPRLHQGLLCTQVTTTLFIPPSYKIMTFLVYHRLIAWSATFLTVPWRTHALSIFAWKALQSPSTLGLTVIAPAAQYCKCMHKILLNWETWALVQTVCALHAGTSQNSRVQGENPSTTCPALSSTAWPASMSCKPQCALCRDICHNPEDQKYEPEGLMTWLSLDSNLQGQAIGGFQSRTFRELKNLKSL